MLPVSLTFAGAFSLLNLWLAIRCIRGRRSEKVLIGDGGNTRLTARMRAQANFIEYTPFVLIMIALIELAGGSRTILWSFGIVYVVVRILHPFGLDQEKPNALRGIGAMGTFVVLGGLALWAVWIGAHAPAHAEAIHYL